MTLSVWKSLSKPPHQIAVDLNFFKVISLPDGPSTYKAKAKPTAEEDRDKILLVNLVEAEYYRIITKDSKNILIKERTLIKIV